MVVGKADFFTFAGVLVEEMKVGVTDIASPPGRIVRVKGFDSLISMPWSLRRQWHDARMQIDSVFGGRLSFS